MPNYIIYADGGIVSDLEGNEQENLQVLAYDITASTPQEAWQKFQADNHITQENYENIVVQQVADAPVLQVELWEDGTEQLITNG